MKKDNNFLKSLGISRKELNTILTDNPSLRGTLVGYLGESRLKAFLAQNDQITILPKPDDHDRSQKYDLPIKYKGETFKIEVKSLQSNSIKAPGDNSSIAYKAIVQCDASDCRSILLPNGKSVTTTCLQYGGFDILAVNMFMFNNSWEFAFALNEQLPHATKGSPKKPIPDDCQQYLMKTLIPITYPVEGIFTTDICSLLDYLIAKRRG